MDLRGGSLVLKNGGRAFLQSLILECISKVYFAIGLLPNKSLLAIEFVKLWNDDWYMMLEYIVGSSDAIGSTAIAGVRASSGMSKTGLTSTPSGSSITRPNVVDAPESKMKKPHQTRRRISLSLSPIYCSRESCEV